MYFYFYQVAMVLSLLISVITVLLLRRHRRSNGAGAMIALLIATFIWTAGFLLEANSSTLQRQLFFNNIGYLGSMSLPAAWVVFSFNYAIGRRVLSGKRIVPFTIFPLVITILIWTNNYHHLMWSNEHLVTANGFTYTVKTYGSFFWAALVYNYALIFTGAIVLMRRLFVGSRLYRGQAISLIVGAVLPLAWNIIYVFHLLPLPRKDLTPVMFAVSGVAIAFGVLRFRLFTLMPFAHRFLLQKLSDGVLVFDNELRLSEANPAALIALGEKNDIVDKHLSEIPQLGLLRYLMDSGELSRIELALKGSGEVRFYETEITSMRNDRGNRLGWLVILHDITARKQADDALLESEGRLRELAGELQHQNDQKTVFLHRVAHELKTPLTSVISSSELLLEYNTKKIARKQKEQLLLSLNKSAWRMDAKISQLIDLAGLQIGKISLDLETLDIPQIIDGVLVHMASLFSFKGQTVSKNIEANLPLIKGDRKRIETVLIALLENANKFSPTGARILLKVEAKNGMLLFFVKDAAPKISDSEKSRIFDPFYLGEVAEQSEGLPGLGLGLAVARNLVKLHGGELVLLNESEGEGNTFFFTLPISEE